MTTVALLRKQTRRGFSTWRFCEDPTGACFAISPRSDRRYFNDLAHMKRAISTWRGYGFADYDHAPPVSRGARQLILELAAVSA